MRNARIASRRFDGRILLARFLAMAIPCVAAETALAANQGLHVDISDKLDDQTGGLYPDISEAATAALEAIARRRSIRYQDIGKKGIVISEDAQGRVRVNIDKASGAQPEPAFRAVTFTPDDLASPDRRASKLSQLRDTICGTSYSTFEGPSLEWIGHLAAVPLLAALAAVVIASILTARKRLADYWLNEHGRRALGKEHRNQEDAARRAAGRGYQAWRGRRR